jgi:hypothetical protein
VISATHCGACRHFRNAAATIAAAFPGLDAMGSAYGSVRADDGLCALHDILLSSRATCAQFAPTESVPLTV